MSMIAFRRPSLLAWCLLLSGLVLFVHLGAWQHSRAEHKRERLSAWANAQQAAEVTLRPDAPHFTRANARGRWLPQRYLLDNVVRDSRAGVEVFAPLRGDQGTFLVALGWLPYDGASREPPALAPEPDGLQQVHGIWTPVPAHGLRMGRDWAQASGWPKLMPYFDRDEIASDLGAALADGVLRLHAVSDSAYQRDWRPVDAMPPERHLAYAWQWWSLAAAIIVVFVVVHTSRGGRT